MTDEQLNISKLAEPVHVTVTRNAKGRYQWEISIHTPSADEALATGIDIDKRLREQFKGEMGGAEE